MKTKKPRRLRTRTSSAKRAGRRRLIAPEDLLRFRLVSDPQVSPDGSDVVFVVKHVGQKNEYVSNLWMVSTDGGEPSQFTNGGKDSHPRWSPEGNRIAFLCGRDKHKPQIYTISAEGGEAVALTQLPQGSISTFKWSPDGRMIALSFRRHDAQWTETAKKDRQEKGLSDPPRVIDDWWYRLDGDGYFDAQRYQLYLVDTTTGKHRKVYAKDTLGFFSFDFSPDSKKLAITTNQDRKAMIQPWKDQIVILNVATNKIKNVPDLPLGPKDAVAWSPDGRFLAYASREGKDGTYSTENLELWVCDPVKGNPKSLTAREDHCLMAAPMSDTAEVDFAAHLLWSSDSRRIYMQLGWHGESHLASVRRRGGRINFHTTGPRVYSVGNLSQDGRTMAMTVGSVNVLDEVYVADLAGHDATIRAVTNLNRKLLSELELSKPTSRWVKAADGTKIQLWVMLPPRRSHRRKHPAALEIHGGPHAQYGVGFFHEFQVLAAAGYVVFFSNPRGSKGYGRDHCAAIRGSWGGADWIDIQTVIEYMKRQPFVNAQRMGVMGGSYGGYMTNWAIGHTQEFAAAITDRCVSNLHSMFGTSDFTEAPDRYWPGNSWDRPESLWERSPLKHLGNAKTPTLIIHSEGDLRCNIEQAEQVFTALKLRNVPTRFVRYPRSTSHGFSRAGPPDLRLHRLHQILSWWKKYL